MLLLGTNFEKVYILMTHNYPYRLATRFLIFI